MFRTRLLQAASAFAFAVTACTPQTIAVGTDGPVGVTLSPAAQPRGEVATYRGDAARTGVMPGPEPAGTPAVAWRFERDGGFRNSPVVASGTVYAVAGDGTVHAVDLVTGEERWSVETGSTASASPLLVGDRLIVADEAGVVRSLSLTDGSTGWEVPLAGAITGSPAADGDTIVVATAGGTASALDADTGRIAWTAEIPGAATRSVALAEGLAYVGMEGEVVAIDTSDGTVKWTTRASSTGDTGTPTVADGTVFTATLHSDPADLGLATLDAATGELGWRYASLDRAQLYTPAVAGGRAYVVGHDKKVVALDASTGEVVWSVERPYELEALPAVVGDTVFVVGNDGDAEALDAATGERRWAVPIKGIPFAPAVVDGYLLVGTDLGWLYAIGGA